MDLGRSTSERRNAPVVFSGGNVHLVVEGLSARRTARSVFPRSGLGHWLGDRVEQAPGWKHGRPSGRLASWSMPHL